MKSIIVPKTPTLPKENSLVIQITVKEAEAMLDIYKASYMLRGYKPLGFKPLTDSLKAFINYCNNEQENKC